MIVKNCLGVCKINHPLQSLPPMPSHSLHVFDKHQRVCLKRIISYPVTDFKLETQFGTRSVLVVFRDGQSLLVFFSLETAPVTEDSQCVNLNGQPLL